MVNLHQSEEKTGWFGDIWKKDKVHESAELERNGIKVGADKERIHESVSPPVPMKNKNKN